MKIVIDIPEEQYLLIRHYQDISPNKTHSLAMSIINGTPLPKGHWILKEDKHYYCSECNDMGVDYWDYCPNCGADMRGEQE